MKDYTARAEQIMQRINSLAAISETANGITRTYGSAAFIEGRNLVEGWMREAGLQCRIDNIGNLRAGLPAVNPNVKTYIIASHIDTVVNAGKFDGPLGVLMGIDLLQAIITQNIVLPFNIELIAFCDEEGVRFHTTYLGSKAVAGSFDKSLLSKQDAAGISLRQAVEDIDGHPDEIEKDALYKDNLIGYFEIHIEQGPVLYENGIPVAVVTAIAGQQRAELIFTGAAGHAGTVPMNMRRDALCAGAECILAVEQYGITHKDELVATVGKLNIWDAASNVIPGSVVCSIDVRSADEEKLSIACRQIAEQCGVICSKRGIDFEWSPVQISAPVKCSDRLTHFISKAIEAQDLPLIKLVSGAGHDAVPLSAICDVSMLFVRCYKGISHNPLENVEVKDIAAAIQTSERFLHLLLKDKPIK